MFQQFAVVHGFDKRHFYIQCGFRKITGANFNAMDIRLFMEYQLLETVNKWIRIYGINCVPFLKLEYSKYVTTFNGQYMDVVSHTDQLTTFHLMQMKDQRPFSVVFVRLYYK